MLELPPAWDKCTTASVVTHLLRQTAATGLYAEAARAITKAAIDFMISGPRWNQGRATLRLIPLPDGWRLNDWDVYVLPTADDDTLEQIGKWAKATGGTDVLAPPWSNRLVEHAVRSAFPDHTADISGVDMFCTYRVLWTRLDLNLPHARSLHDLLTRYRNLTQSLPAITLAPTLDTPTD